MRWFAPVCALGGVGWPTPACLPAMLFMLASCASELCVHCVLCTTLHLCCSTCLVRVRQGTIVILPSCPSLSEPPTLPLSHLHHDRYAPCTVGIAYTTKSRQAGVCVCEPVAKSVQHTAASVVQNGVGPVLVGCMQPSPHSSGLLPTQALSQHSPELLSEQALTAFFLTVAPRHPATHQAGSWSVP